MWTLCANLKSVRLRAPDLPVTGINALSSARHAELKAVEPERGTVDETADIGTADDRAGGMGGCKMKPGYQRQRSKVEIAAQLMTHVEACKLR